MLANNLCLFSKRILSFKYNVLTAIKLGIIKDEIELPLSERSWIKFKKSVEKFDVKTL